MKLAKWFIRKGLSPAQCLDSAHEMEQEKPAFRGKEMRKFRRIQTKYWRGFATRQNEFYSEVV